MSFKHQELEQHHLAMEPLAGLAQVALSTGNESVALLRAEEILDYLEQAFHPLLNRQDLVGRTGGNVLRNDG